MIIHGLDCSFDVNTPGDLHLMNDIMNFSLKCPQCAGVKSGIAVVAQVELRIEIPEKGTQEDYCLEHILCPQSCPRDEQSIQERCLVKSVERGPE